MILNISGRTDIVNHYSDWLFRRFQEDYARYGIETSGCKYCYANKNADLPRENYKLHDPSSPLLIGHLKPTDRLEQGLQKSFLQYLANCAAKATREENDAK